MAQALKTSWEEPDHRSNGSSLKALLEKLNAYPRRLRQFMHEVRVEMRQVNWPSAREVWTTTVVVTVTVAFFGVFFAFTDYVFSHGASWLLGRFLGH
ncbi:MAG: preprotein translocase subunit SecE [Candidatus Acidiferrales bacterium]